MMMSQQPTLPTYTELTNVLQTTTTQKRPSEIHGTLCGHLCGQQTNDLSAWWQVIFGGEETSADVSAMLGLLSETSLLQLTDFSFDFSLLLPEDDESINVRAEALGAWCEGFLTGLHQAGFSVPGAYSNEVQEALNDLSEIAKISFGEMVTNDEDEQAYFELVEYVRLSVILIFQELRPKNNITEPVLH